MGMRLHRVLGYGAKAHVPEDFRTKLYDGFDGEVDALLTADLNRLTGTGVSTGSLGNETDFAGRKSPYPPRFRNVVHFAEHPDKSHGQLVFVTPSEWRFWFRKDDPIDLAEAGLTMHRRKDPYKTHVKRLDWPLYPYMGLMDPKTGADIDAHPLPWDPPPPAGVPKVPLVVRLLCAHLAPNGEPEFWKKLRPMIVTWWC